MGYISLQRCDINVPLPLIEEMERGKNRQRDYRQPGVYVPFPLIPPEKEREVPLRRRGEADDSRRDYRDDWVVDFGIN